MPRKLALAAGLILGATAAQAQDGWTREARLYMWFSGIQTTSDTKALGPVSTDVSADDVLSNLDFGLMAAVEGRKGPWTLAGDLIYSDLSHDADLSGPLGFSQSGIKTEMTILSLYGLYRVSETLNFAIDMGVGLRGVDSKLTTSLVGSTRSSYSFESDASWVDPLIAARIKVPFNDRWSGTLFADYGGTDSSDKTWQILATVTYQINDRWGVQAGYRRMWLQHDLGNTPTTIVLDGPAIGATFKF
ncbi:MAG: hypothetical protein DI533_11345 [Cereibacter sphaeroides]|uniref:Uncharacterized protein n=1 Tax=Cereibacter sphaeroides TaxID=1063 RepID=A0A2W5SCV6_CERSP|nr:MAG: hypothetical protein DI533_11345 [Cereibacter sphaeroides]